MKCGQTFGGGGAEKVTGHYRLLKRQMGVFRKWGGTSRKRRRRKKSMHRREGCHKKTALPKGTGGNREIKREVMRLSTVLDIGSGKPSEIYE